jgi:hypothetical protein
MKKTGLIALLALSLVGSMNAADAAPRRHAHHAKPAEAPAPVRSLDEIKASMVGTWQDVNDKKFTRELDKFGGATDRREGDDAATAQGMWVIFIGSSAPADFANSNLNPDGVFFELQQKGALQLFAVTKADGTSIWMIPVGQHKLLKYTRIK